MENNEIDKKYSSRIYLPRSSLKPIEVSLTLNINPNYHILDEIERLEKQNKRMSSLENGLKD